MQEYVEMFFIGCILYSNNKPSNQKLVLYMPFPVPNGPWESISMDFVGGLPMTHRDHEYLFFVVDRFKKMCVLILCRKIIYG
jgi:hypothetical protein